MEKDKILLTSIIVILGIISGIILIFVFDGEKEIDNNKENIVSQSLEEEYKENKEKEELVAAASVQEKVSNDAELILKKYYIQCEHTINETVELPQEIINMKKEDVEKQYPDWKVIGFDKDKITLYKEFDDVCGEHFKLKVEDGKIVVYKENNDGSEILYEKTNISSEYLTEADLLNMQDGLEIYGKEELNQVIEDFE